jgi:hypothetical protein
MRLRPLVATVVAVAAFGLGLGVPVWALVSGGDKRFSESVGWANILALTVGTYIAAQRVQAQFIVYRCMATAMFLPLALFAVSWLGWPGPAVVWRSALMFAAYPSTWLAMADTAALLAIVATATAGVPRASRAVRTALRRPLSRPGEIAVAVAQNVISVVGAVVTGPWARPRWRCRRQRRCGWSPGRRSCCVSLPASLRRVPR